jgi:hypothetical protein
MNFEIVGVYQKNQMEGYKTTQSRIFLDWITHEL